MSSKIDPANWTIAFRKPRANRFLRLTSWSGTWSQAVAMARLFGELHPELQVYYVSNEVAERAGRVHADDVGNILVDSGRRVRIVDVDDELPAELLARIPAADVAQARWSAGEPIADPEPVAEVEPAGLVVEFDRIGARRTGAALTLRIEPAVAADPAEVARVLRRHVGRHIASREFDLYLDDDGRTVLIDGGRFGRGTITTALTDRETERVGLLADHAAEKHPAAVPDCSACERVYLT